MAPAGFKFGREEHFKGVGLVGGRGEPHRCGRIFKNLQKNRKQISKSIILAFFKIFKMPELNFRSFRKKHNCVESFEKSLKCSDENSIAKMIQ